MEESLVSVIMPTYKQKELLYKAVDSVLNQTYNNFELIIIDDNIDINFKVSNKNYFDNLNNCKIRYIQNEKNLGSAKSRNLGILLSKGEYVTFLDDDDYYLDNKIKDQVEVKKKYNSDYSVCNMILVNEKGKVIDKRERNYFSKKISLLEKHLKYHITGTDTFMFKKSFINEINMFDEKDLGDEFYLMLKAINKSEKISHLDKICVVATVHNNTGLSSYEKKIETEKDLFDFKKRYFSKISKKSIRYIKMRHYLVNSLAYKKGKKYFKFFKNLVIAFILSPIGMINIGIGKDR